MPGLFSGINMRTHMDQMGNCSAWSWCWCTRVLSWYLKGLCGNRIGKIHSPPPHRLSCSVWKRGVGWRKACTLAGKIWQTHDRGLRWRQDNNETIQVLKRCLLRQSLLVKDGTNKKTADRRIRCWCGTWKCWTCQTIFSCPLFFCIAYFCHCYRRGKHNKI